MKYIILIGLLIITACSSKLVDKKNSKNIHKAIAKGDDIMLVGLTIEDEIDLTKIVKLKKFNAKSSYGQVTGNIFFMDCTFKKPFLGFAKNKAGGENAIQFKNNVSFINCTFEDEFSLKSCTIMGSVDFSNTTFKKKSNFQDAIFMQRANFNKAFWADEAQFQNVRFYHKTNFMDIKADNHLMFQAAVFHDETNFSMSECLKYVDFSLVRFDGLALFNYLKWKDRAVFNDAVWMMDCTMIEPEFGDVSFKNCDIRGEFTLKGEKINGSHITAEAK